MSYALLTRLAAEAERPEKINHWIIGAIMLVILLGSLCALLVFSGGREHS